MLALLGLVTCTPVPSPEVQESADLAQAEVALREWYRHLEAGHLDSLTNVTTPDFIAIDGADTIGISQAIAHFKSVGVRRTRTTSLEFHRRAVSGGVAAAIATWTGTVEVDTLTVPEQERLTVLSRREGDVWRIAAIHLTILTPQ